MKVRTTLIGCATALVMTASAHQLVRSQSVLQDAPDYPTHREKLLREWAARQKTSVAATDFITFTRTTEQIIDSPHGRDHTKRVAEVYGRPSSGFWVDHLVSAFVNGRAVEEQQLVDHKKRWRPGLKPYMEIVENINPLPPETIENLQPSTPLQPDTVDRIPVWSFNAVTADEESQLERATLWFRQDSLQLEQSRAIYEPVNGQSLIVTTDYTRVGDLDVPRRIECEGIFRYKRRLRSFTLLVRATTVYNNFSLAQKDTSLTGQYTIETDTTQVQPK